MTRPLLPSAPSRARAFVAALLCAAAGMAQADTYTLPADLTSAPFNCTGSGNSYSCHGSIGLDKDSIIQLTSDVTLNIDGNLTADKSLSTSNNGHSLTLYIGGSANFKKETTLTADLTVGGSISFDKDATVNGDITTGGNMTMAKDSTVYGDVVVGGYLDMGKDSDIIGTCRAAATNYTCSAVPSGIHHLRIEHAGTALTCSPATITVRACSAADNNGCTASTAGISGTVRASSGGSVLASTAFNIPAGVSTATITLPVTSATATTLSAAGMTPTPSNATTCWVGATQSCTLTFADSGFFIDVPDHISDTTASGTVKAARKDDASSACVPAFTGAKAVPLSCQYVNPGTGTKSLTLTGSSTATMACNGTPSPINLSFDTNGVAPLQVRYPDAGQIGLDAHYVAGALDMQGSDQFIVAPKDFAVNAAVSNIYVAGSPFALQIIARNNSGATTLNFGKESTPATAILSRTRCEPSANGTHGETPQDGTLSTGTPNNAVSMNSGVAFVTTTEWTEVGKIIVKADHTNYLGSALSVTGTVNNSAGCASPIGPFVPHHFSTTVTDAYPANPSTDPTTAFTYSGQPMVLLVAAKNGHDATTQNYYLANSGSSFAKDVTLTALLNPTPAPGSLLPSPILAKDFAGGVATANASYTFTNIKTAPTAVTIRANDANASSQSGIEGIAHVRSGRLRVSNVFGSARQALKIPVQAEYWTGQAWILNVNDTGAPATQIKPSSVALSFTSSTSSPSFSGSTITGPTIVLSGGKAEIPLSAPTVGTGYIDFAINLGTTAADNSCLATHPATVGNVRTWLRSTYSTCVLSDPYARATFGIYTPAQKSVIHVREVY
ncbi:DUF6701 domain-containing protein [Pseudoduganella sp. RAF19]|uniref:DUF6701 domain-containing protein n=1 Tax=Pseudoduganella sp. RAF19 TaxID=3233052 RepID=UPI003F9C6D96